MSAFASAAGDRSPVDHELYAKMGMLEFKALAETIPSLVFVTDANGSNIYTNVQFARYAGLEAEALLGDGWLQVIHPADRARAAETWARSYELGEAYDTRYRFRRFDGDYRWHVVRGSPLRDATGEIVRWMGACTDIDDLVPAINTKTNSEAVLDALGHGTGMILYAKDSEGRFIYANQETIETIGLPIERIIGHSTDELAPGSEQAAAIRKHDILAQIAPDGLVAEENWLAADGTMRTYRSRKARLRLVDGSLGLAAATIDITNEKRLENELRGASERLLAWIDAVPVATFETDGLGRITSVNQHWLDTCGFPMRNADHAFADIIVEPDHDAFMLRWSACLEYGQALDMRVRIYDHFQHKVRNAHVTAYPASMLKCADSAAWYGSFA